MNKWNLYWVSKNLGAISNCYKRTNTKSSYLISVFKVLIFRFEGLIFDLKVRSLESMTQFGCLFSSIRIVRCFFLVEREDPDLKVWSFGNEATFACFFSFPGILRCFLFVERIGLALKVDLRSRGNVFMCLFSSFRIFNRLCSLLEEKVLILKAFLLERERLIWGGVGSIIEKIPILHLRSNIDLDFLLAFIWALN